jgi:hypothetical protein
MNPIMTLNQPMVNVGLGTSNYTVLTAGTLFVEIQASVTTPSSLVIQTFKNGGLINTAPAFAPTQSSLTLKFDFQVAVNDLIAITLSSAAQIDNALNNVKSIISVGQGQIT